ncbi:hypothetical protein M413DRAFT_415478 [Hebeloma cylindrosporum]|uniref:Uncharacterized protein n=1 Tax=Hebeloma cylindrosporum TaxID=76867 RepID=A0A0C2YES1_HEBCY|nr:hypothetical protein M413DRAFT_415478 [Hebeloma cylindrosporum h7]
MITPPPIFHTPVVLWSKLRVLTLSPFEEKGMACLRPILEVACNTLEELYLTNSTLGIDDQLPLAGLVDLSKLSRLRVFAIYPIIRCDEPGSTVIRDINTVLSTISASNTVTKLSFDFMICGEHPFGGCLDEDWEGIYDEVIRISSGKSLELDFYMALDKIMPEWEYYGEHELSKRIKGKATSLSGHPKIWTHFWNPSGAIQ